MGAFDRLMTYSSGLKDLAKGSAETASQVADTALEIINRDYPCDTPLGYFLKSLHNLGYLVVEQVYQNDNGATLTAIEYNKLTPEDKSVFKPVYQYTEFANMLLSEGDNLVIAGAGSGKTTALVFKIMKDILTGEAMSYVNLDGNAIPVIDKIFVGTFLKSGADELKETVGKWQRKLGYVVTADQINFGTLHAEFKRALNDLGVATPIGSADVVRGCLKSAINSLHITREDGRNLGYEDYTAIESIVTYYRNRLGTARYSHPACAEYSLRGEILDALVQMFAQNRSSKGIMDFEDLQELLYKYLYITPNKAVQDFIANRYKYIYLDEFQDTSEIQYAIIRFYARGRLAVNKGTGILLDDTSGLYTGQATKGKIVAIGDDDQCIYSWRGSDIDVMCTRFPNEFAPTVLSITRNYRCPSNILEPVITSIEENTKRYSKKLRSAKEGGEFAALHFSGITPMLENLKAQIDEDMAKGRSVAIICRTNFDGVIPALLLEMEHNYMFSVSSEAMTLSSTMPRDILNACRLFTDKTTPSVQKTLETIVPYTEKYSIKKIMERLRSDKSVGVNSSIWTLDERDISYTCQYLIKPLRTMKAYMFDSNGTKIKGGDIQALKWLYFYMLSEVFDGDSAYSIKARSYIEAVLYLLNSKQFDSTYEFLDCVNEYSERLNARIRYKNASISIVTVHEFKGKERDAVYVWHSSDKFFPVSRTDLNNREQVEEERRVHYIACTRAREKCVVYSLRGAHSMFLDEMDCTVTDPTVITGTLTKNNNLSVAKSVLDEQNNIQGIISQANASDSICVQLPDVDNIADC